MRKAVIGIAAASVLMLAACGDDSDDSSSGGLTGDNGTTTLAPGGDTTTVPVNQGSTTTVPGTVTTAPPTGGSGSYSEAEHTAFVSACVSTAGQAASSICECMWTEITQTMSYEDFVAYEELGREDPATAAANPPPELTAAAATCGAG